MIYRLIFSFIPLIGLPMIGFDIIISIFISILLVAGTLLSKNRGWIPQLQSVTLVLLYAISIFGYLNQGYNHFELILILVSMGYLFSGLFGFFLENTKLAIIFSIIFWSFEAASIALLAFQKIGIPGILVSLILFLLIAYRDYRKIILSKNKINEDQIDQ
ncbi:MAG: hypothetical protein PWQ77_1868 [Kosmotogales bacterium]|nr:hypothetical protein [Kosmotogales bacterium]